MRRRSSKCANGMTLLEVLVAFVVLSLVAGVSMEIFSSGARVSVRISERERAAALAESKLTVASSGPIETGTWQGEWEQNSWRIRVEDVTPQAFSGPELCTVPIKCDGELERAWPS